MPDPARVASTPTTRPPRRRPFRRIRRLVAAGLAIGFGLLVPSLTLAHPLGNFTINHYAGIRVEPGRVILDVVIDHAEIPTFQERQRIDADGNGVVSDAEIERERQSACPILATSLALTAAGRPLPLAAEAAGLTFAPGAAGLQTMRLVCIYAAPLPPVAGTMTIGFTDTSHAERIGWREITAQGSGLTIEPGGAPSTSISNRLTVYPTSMLTSPLDVRSSSIAISPGGAMLPPFEAPDATTIPGAPVLYPGSAAGGPGSADAGPAAPAAAVPGGVGSDISGLLQTQDLTPLVLLGSILVAMALGAGHALTPGHGKTLMGAYLVGTRGTPIHALALGLSVTVSHTIGILVLAGIVIAFRGAVPPETFNRVAPLASGLLVLGIGSWLLVSQLRARRAARQLALAHGHEHEREESHEHDHEREHSHGGITHSHVPAAAGNLTWRNLFFLGLAGGIIPSTNALIILLATIATGRAVYGFVLVVAFGLGMAAVLGGVGLGLVLARDRFERLPSRSNLGRFAALAPVMAGAVVFALGIFLTTQAVGAAPTL
jgi:ABC-type nickel/cobalt efflux system permease component RcnA